MGYDGRGRRGRDRGFHRGGSRRLSARKVSRKGRKSVRRVSRKGRKSASRTRRRGSKRGSGLSLSRGRGPSW